MAIDPPQPPDPALTLAALGALVRAPAEGRHAALAALAGADHFDIRREQPFFKALGLTGPPRPEKLAQARAAAAVWEQWGVEAVALPESPSGFLFCRGVVQLLTAPTAAVINSRTPKTIHPADRWLRALKDLAAEAGTAGRALVASVGNHAFELLCRLAADRAFGLIVVLDRPLPDMDSKPARGAFWAEYEGMFPEGRTVLASPLTPGPSLPARSVAQIRDELVVRLAGRVYAAEVRGGGRMADLALAALGRGARVTAVVPDGSEANASGNQALLDAGARPRPGPEPIQRPRRVVRPADRPKRETTLPPGRWLIHFTRSRPGPWPGQRRREYYQSLIDAAPDAAHTALDALLRILWEKRIRGGTGMVRGGRAVVSLTACGLDRLSDLVRFRPALARWTLEPYGLALPQSWLMSQGARPVIYTNETGFSRLPDDQRYRYQPRSTAAGRWRLEREWRLAGDLDFSGLDPSRIRAVAPSEADADAIRAAGGPDVVVAAEW